MLFNSYLFIFVFLPVTLALIVAGRYLYGARGGLACIVSGSLVFYGYWNPIFLVLLLGSILVNHQIGLRIMKTPGKHPKTWLLVGIFLNMGVLGYFKYWNFFLVSLAQVLPFDPNIHPLVLPLGISFYTFQQIAFIVDVYHKKIKRSSFLEYMAFVSFFPQLIAGPIIRYNTVHGQFISPEWLRWNNESFATGLSLFSLGLFKKTVLADQLAVFVGPVFDAGARGDVVSIMEAWTATLAYTFQLYFDFSGYADMALGLGAMMGIRLPDNFNSPYRAHNFINFWQRWHISLSHFFRDYLYIPLGGSRCSFPRHLNNLMITMLLCGLWHGAGWQFVFWGGMHGLFLILDHLRESRFPNLRLPRPLGVLVTFLVIALLWTAFRAVNMGTALYLYKTMFCLSGFLKSVPLSFPTFDIANFITAGSGSAPYWLILSALIVWGLPNTAAWCRLYTENEGAFPVVQGRTKAIVAGMLFFVSLKVLAGSGSSEFLYFNF